LGFPHNFVKKSKIKMLGYDPRESMSKTVVVHSPTAKIACGVLVAPEEPTTTPSSGPPRGPGETDEKVSAAATVVVSVGVLLTTTALLM
jgi:hypothetical protein